MNNEPTNESYMIASAVRTIERCYICIPGRAFVERFLTCLRPPSLHLTSWRETLGVMKGTAQVGRQNPKEQKVRSDLGHQGGASARRASFRATFDAEP